MEYLTIIKNLVERKRDLQERIGELQDEEEELSNAIKFLEKQCCPQCRGTGELRLSDEAGGYCYEICDQCGGTGMSKK